MRPARRPARTARKPTRPGASPLRRRNSADGSLPGLLDSGMRSTGQLLDAAVANNASWCAAVCGAHGHPGVRGRRLWASPGHGVRFYPDAITLSPAVSAAEVLAVAPPSGAFAVKDSYGTLDLAPAGFLRSARSIQAHCSSPASRRLPPACGPACPSSDTRTEPPWTPRGRRASTPSATCASGCGRPRWEKSSGVGRSEPGADPVVNGGPAEDARVPRWRGHRLLAGGRQGQGGALAAGAARPRVIVTL
jgi:hypothetical protein